MQRTRKDISLKNIETTKKYTKICSTSLITMEMQIKTTMRCHLTPVSITIIKNSKRWQVLARMSRNWNPSRLQQGQIKKKKINPDSFHSSRHTADPLPRLIFLSSLCYKTLSLQEELKTASWKVEIKDKKKTTHQEWTGIHARLNVTFRQRWQYL